jgi:hypothetical protein
VAEKEISSGKKAGTGAFGRVGMSFVLKLSLLSTGDLEALLFFLLSRMRFVDLEDPPVRRASFSPHFIGTMSSFTLSGTELSRSP